MTRDKILGLLTKQETLVVAMAILFIGLFFSVFLISVGQISIMVLALIHFLKTKRLIEPSSRRSLLLMCLIFVIPLFGGLYSTDLQYFLERLRIKLPYLLLPISFIALPNLDSSNLRKVAVIFVVLALASTIGVIVNYGLHFSEIQELIYFGGHIPTPASHIRYSLLIAIAILLSIALSLNIVDKLYRYSFAGIALVLFVFIHFLSVRSGIFGLYVGVIILLVLALFRFRSWRALLIVPLLAVLAFVSIKNLPSLQTKMGYTIWEIKTLMSDQNTESTLSQRIKSYRCGTEIFKSAPMLGVGTGDVKSQMSYTWTKLFPDDKDFIMPHNQFITWLVAHGLILSVFLVLIVLYPFAFSKVNSNVFSIAILALVLSSFLFENTIETSLGVAIHSFFALFVLRYGSFIHTRD